MILTAQQGSCVQLSVSLKIFDLIMPLIFLITNFSLLIKIVFKAELYFYPNIFYPNICAFYRGFVH